MTRDEYMQAARVGWALRTYGPGYAITPGGLRDNRVRWYCGPTSRQKAARDRRRSDAARPQRTLTRRELQSAKARLVPCRLRDVNRRLLDAREIADYRPQGEQLDLLGGRS
jgi:hypothetical protein